jgi:hypothetical protein
MARNLKILVIKDHGKVWDPYFENLTEWHSTGTRMDLKWYRWRTKKLVWVPPFVPDLPSGVPSPKSIGPYKIFACKVEKLILEKGWVCGDDIKELSRDVGKHYGLGSAVWFLKCTGEPANNGTRQKKWVLENFRPSNKWPSIFDLLK